LFPIEDFGGVVTKLVNEETKKETMKYWKEAYKHDEAAVIKHMQLLPPEYSSNFKEFLETKQSMRDADSMSEERVNSQIEEVSLQKRFGDQWCNQLMTTRRWNERRDKLEELLKIIIIKKIKKENCNELIKTLKELLKDPNTVISNLSLKIIGQLAKKLKGYFSIHTKHCFDLIVQKFKDKRTVVEAQKCMENLVSSLRFEEILEQIKEALNDKSAIIKVNICIWLESAVLPKLSITVAKTIVGVVLPLLIKMTEDASVKVRETALSCIGTIRVVLGNDCNVEKLINGLNEYKKDRLEIDWSKDRIGSEAKESFERKIEVTPDSSSNRIGDSASKSLSSSTKPRKTIPRTKVMSPAEITPEEDLPPAISSATAIKLIYEHIPPSILAQFDMNDSNDRQQGLNDLAHWIQSNNGKTQELIEPITVWIKKKLNNFNDPEVEYFSLLKVFCNACVMNKRFAYEVIPLLIERIGDAMEIILLIADSANPSYIATLIIKSCYPIKNNQIIKASLLLLHKLLEEYGSAMIALKASVDYAKYCLDNKNAQVVNAAVRYLVAVYSEIGKGIRPWLVNLKDNVIRTLEAEFNKSHKVFFKITRRLKGETAILADKNRQVTGYTIPQSDISAYITAELISNPKLEIIKQILINHNNRILPKGLTPLIDALKKQIDRGNVDCIEMVGDLAVAMEKNFEEYCSSVFNCLVHKLNEEQAEMNSIILITLEKLVTAVGAELMINYISKRLEDNSMARKELLQWLLSKKELLRKANNKCLLKVLVLILNSKEDIKVFVEQLIREILKDVDYKVFVSILNDLSTIENVDEILDKFNPDKENRQSIILEAVTVQPIVLSVKSKLKHFEALTTRIARNNSKIRVNLSLAEKDKKREHTPGDMTVSRSTKNLSQHFDRRSKSKLPEYKKAARRLSNPSSNFTQSIDKNPFTSSESIVLSPIGNKDKRSEARITYPIGEIKKDYIETLKKAFKGLLNEDIVHDMFSLQAIKNINAINELIEGLKAEPMNLLELFDLIAKWVGMKIINQTSSTVTKELLRLLNEFFNKMIEVNYIEFEILAILSILCEKLGTEYRDHTKELIVLMAKLCEPIKICSQLITTLDVTKNKKTKLEALIMIKEFTRKYKLNKGYSTREIKCLSKFVISTDNLLKSESLDILHEIYKAKGESLWKLLGELPEGAKIVLAKKFNTLGSMDKNARRSRRANNPSLDLGRTSEGNQILGTRMRNVQTKTLNRTKQRIASPTTNYINDNSIKSGNTFKETTDSTQQNSKEIDTLEEALESLRTGEISKRVEALMYLNEKTSSSFEEEEKDLILNGDKLLITFAEVLNEIFESEPKDVPIRFTKYFMTVVSKVCSNKTLISKVKKQSFLLFAEQLLTKLLYEGLERLGDSNEGEYLVKIFNSTMLKILEYYDPTKSFTILLDLFKKYKTAPELENNIRTGKLPGLIVKCILKMTNAIYTFIDILDTSKILLSLHDYLLANPAKTGTDDIGIRMAKTVIYELVNVKGESIWEDYKPIELSSRQDTQIKLWINLILKSTHPISASPPKYDTKAKDPLKQIFDRLQSHTNYKEAIKELNEYLEEYPTTDLSLYFIKYRASFKSKVLTSLEEYRDSLEQDELLPKDKEYSPQTEEEIAISTSNAESSLSEYESRMAYLQQKFFDKKGSEHKKVDLND
jgi:hypothetical protein